MISATNRKKLNVGIAGGVSLNIYRFVVGLEYSRRLLKLDDSSSMHNQAFGITARYKIQLNQIAILQSSLKVSKHEKSAITPHIPIIHTQL